MPDKDLSASQKAEFERQWRAFDLSLEKGLALRRRARTDLFWLCNTLLGKTLAPPHKEVCDFFVHKDPDVDYLTFATNYDHPHIDGLGRICRGSHESLLWLMRSGLKSAIDICDKVQWIITYPDIRIRILTDVLALAQQFVGGVVGHFQLQANGEPAELNGKPSLFQILFPEFCEVPRREDFESMEVPLWTSPARDRSKRIIAPTIIAGSLQAGKTGSHCDVLVFDDAITPENVGKDEKAIVKNLPGINKRISMTLNLLDHPGFLEFIGTPQHKLDYLSQKVTAEQERLKKGQLPKCRVLVRPAYKITNATKTALKPPDLTQDDVEEWWPERMPFHEVQARWGEPEGRDTVATQLLLDVGLKETTKFTRAVLLSVTVPWNRVPRDGLKVMSGDLAYSTKPRADYTSLGTAILQHARFHLVGLKRGRFGPREMAREIALEIFKQRPDKITIEDSQGAQWLHNDIERELKALGYEGVSIEWLSIGQGKYKKIEMEADLPIRLMGDQRLLLSTEIEKLEDLYDELEAFPSPAHHDDIVAMLNQMCKRFITDVDIMLARSADNARTFDDSMWVRNIHGQAAQSNSMTSLNDLISTELPE